MISACFQLGPKFEVIVDLAVVDDDVAAIRREYRLMAAGEVDNTQSLHVHAKIGIDPGPIIIGPAMNDGITLLLDERGKNRVAAASIPASNPAHSSSPNYRGAIARRALWRDAAGPC